MELSVNRLAEQPLTWHHATSWDALRPRIAEWDRLAQMVPFRTWDWLESWWHHYGVQHSAYGNQATLAILYATDTRDQLIGIAPWYLVRHVAQGSVLRFLGSGDVCSDHLSLLCATGDETSFAHELARHLLDQRTSTGPLAWDLIELTGVDQADLAVASLLERFETAACTVYRRSTPACWQLDLSGDWQDYLAQLSKSHRKQLRRIERRLIDAGRSRLHAIEQPSDLATGLDRLIDFQRRRRRQRREETPFNDRRYVAFLDQVAHRLHRTGQLWMHWVELEGRTAAVEFYLAGDRVLYAYQGGIEPDLLDREPGRLSNILMLRRALEQGFTAVDLLRGDEPYKQHWRARPRATLAARVVSPSVPARMRHQAWSAGENMKQWIKKGLGYHAPPVYPSAPAGVHPSDLNAID